jgi:hypothetical protein
MKMTKTIIAAAAMLGIGYSVPAHATVMVLGIGSMNCSRALHLDWNSAGITSWIQGYMTAQEGWAKSGGGPVDFLHGKASTRVAGLVLKQCRDDPDLSINDAAAFVAARLITDFETLN